MARPTLHILALLLCLTLTSTACQRGEPAPTTYPPVKGQVPVDLPDKPTLDELQAAHQTRVDGVLTVNGLLTHLDRYADTNIVVAGVVRDLSDDQPSLTRPKPAPKPSRRRRTRRRTQTSDQLPISTCRKRSTLQLVISDPHHPRGALVLTCYHPFFHPHLRPGQPLIVRGHYDPDDGHVLVHDILNLAVTHQGAFLTEPQAVAEAKERHGTGMAKILAKRY